MLAASCFPIQELPSELLAEIFYWYILAIFEALDEPYPKPPTPYAWLTVRHVCRSWRNVALSYPKLNTRIWLNRPDCVQDILERSGKLPLYIMDPYPRLWDAEAIFQSYMLILPHLSRVTHARLTLTDHLVLSIASLDVIPAIDSKLRSLHLVFMRQLGPDLPSLDPIEFAELREFICSLGSFRAVSSMLSPRLRRLELSNCSPVSPGDLARWLQPLQELELLVLREVLDQSTLASNTIATASSLADTVILPKLRHFQLSNSSAEDGLDLAHRIRCPPNASIQLHFGWTSRPDLFDFMIEVMVAKLRREGKELENESACSMCIVSDEQFDIRFCILDGHRSLRQLRESTHTGTPAWFQFSVVMADGNFVQRLFYELRVPLSVVRTAQLYEGKSKLHQRCWGSIFCALNNVTDLALIYHSVQKASDAELQTALFHEPSDSDAEDVLQYFPCLQNVHVSVTEHRDLSCMAGYQRNTNSPLVLMVVARALAARANTLDMDLETFGTLDFERTSTSHSCLRPAPPDVLDSPLSPPHRRRSLTSISSRIKAYAARVIRPITRRN